MSEKREKVIYIKKQTLESAATKFEEKLARKLGEVAILMHLSRSPEGSHAYEMRSKVSEILFNKQKKGLEFLQYHYDELCLFKDFIENYEPDSEDYDYQHQKIARSIEEHPIFKFNPHIQNLLDRKDIEKLEEDFEYLNDMLNSFEKTIKDMKGHTTVWSNISGIYPAIDSLENSGLIKFSREDSEGGRLKKIYEITELGRKTLARVILSIVDLTGFIFSLDNQLLTLIGKRKIPFLNPIRDLMHKIAEDLPNEARKKLLMRKGKKHPSFVRKIMEHGLPLPNPRFLVHNPHLIKQHLKDVESENERKLAKDFLKEKLLSHKEKIEIALKELKESD